MIFEVCDQRAEPVRSDWEPAELELEKYLISKADGASNAALLDAKVFGEPLLLLENQVFTRQGKRADIVALDQYGNGVFIELKKREAKQGIETQALQYLANYANLKGERFLHRFSPAKAAIDEFLGDYDVYSLNQKSRIMLVARSFDESVLSMGEWLASQGIAFRCIEYLPFDVQGRKFLSFSVRFDRSRESLYQLSWADRVPQCFWHNIGTSPLSSNNSDAGEQQTWWNYHLSERMISAGFANEPGDAGDKLLNSYGAKDTVIAYTSGFGAIGWGVIDRPEYELVSREHDQFAGVGHRHRLTGVNWKNVAQSVNDAISAQELKERFGLNHPIQTKSKIRREQAEALITEMKKRFTPPA
jgi:hypothetical protein